MLSRAWGRRRVDGVMDLGRTTVLRARGLREVDGTTSLGTSSTWAMASPTQVREDGSAYGGYYWDQKWWCGGSREDSMRARAPERSTAAQAPVKFFAGNFDILTAWVKTHRDWGCKSRAIVYLLGNNIINDMGDITRSVAVEDHSTDGRLPSSARCSSDSCIYIAPL
jgi:hypothetical protein